MRASRDPAPPVGTGTSHSTAPGGRGVDLLYRVHYRVRDPTRSTTATGPCPSPHVAYCPPFLPAFYRVSYTDCAYTPITEGIYATALSRDAVPKPLCQKCYRLLTDEKLEEAVEAAENVSAVVEEESFGTAPPPENIYARQVAEFVDLMRYVKGKESFLIDDQGLLRKVRNGSLVIVVKRDLVRDVLQHVHGSSLAGHYGVMRILHRLVGEYWWKGMIQDTASIFKNCFQCNVATDRKPGRQVGLGVVHLRKRFEQVSIDVRTITPRTKSGCIKVLVIIDVFMRFVHATAVPDEKAETLARVIIDG